MSDPPENLVIVNKKGKSKSPEPSATTIKPLPPISAFKYDSIISHCSAESDALKAQVQNIAHKYRHDLSCEVDEVRKAQTELVRRMAEIDALLVAVGTQVQVQIQTQKGGKTTMRTLEAVADQSEQTYHRIETIVNQLYSIESRLPVYERLSGDKSPHKDHYPLLHQLMDNNSHVSRPNSASNSKSLDTGDTSNSSSSSTASTPESNPLPLSRVQEMSLRGISMARRPSSFTPMSDIPESKVHLNTKRYPQNYPKAMINIMASSSNVTTDVSPIEPQTLFEEHVPTTVPRMPRRMISLHSLSSQMSVSSYHSNALPLMEADSASTVSRATMKSSFSFRGIADFLKGSPKKKMSAEQRLRGFL